MRSIPITTWSMSYSGSPSTLTGKSRNSRRGEGKPCSPTMPCHQISNSLLDNLHRRQLRRGMPAYIAPKCRRAKPDVAITSCRGDLRYRSALGVFGATGANAGRLGRSHANAELKRYRALLTTLLKNRLRFPPDAANQTSNLADHSAKRFASESRVCLGRGNELFPVARFWRRPRHHHPC